MRFHQAKPPPARLRLHAYHGLINTILLLDHCHHPKPLPDIANEADPRLRRQTDQLRAFTCIQPLHSVEIHLIIININPQPRYHEPIQPRAQGLHILSLPAYIYYRNGITAALVALGFH